MSLILVTGGAHSGKSAWAIARARELATLGGGSVLFVATSEVRDMEMRLRIAQLRKSRPRSWKTIEATTSVAARLLGKVEPEAVIILETIPSLTSNIMAGENVRVEPARVEQVIQSELRAILRIVSERKATLIAVTSETGLGPDLEEGRHFRDVLGRVNQWLAEQAEGVWLTACGLALPLHTLAIPIGRMRE